MSAKTSPYITSHYPSRPSAPWKLEIRAHFAGRKIRRFFSTKADADAAAPLLVAQIRTQGTHSLDKPKHTGLLLAALLTIYKEHKVSSIHL